MTLKNTYRLGRELPDSRIGRSSYATPEERVVLRAFARGLPDTEVLDVTLSSTFRLGRQPSDSQNREVPISGFWGSRLIQGGSPRTPA